MWKIARICPIPKIQMLEHFSDGNLICGLPVYHNSRKFAGN